MYKFVEQSRGLFAQNQSRAGRFLLPVLALLFALNPAFAQTITGKVTGVSDGDTIKVLTADKKEVKIRFDGVDCPETGQPFGSTAKQFTSKAVFGKSVEVKVKDTDRYGRTVGVVIVDGRNLNQSLVKSGMAWWYRKYAPSDATLKQLEFEARQAKIGVWSEPKTAIAPWDWRRGKRPVTDAPVRVAGSSNGRISSRGVSKPAASVPIGNTVYITNTGHKYHEAGCRHLRSSSIAISLKDAEAQGYSPCAHCH